MEEAVRGFLGEVILFSFLTLGLLLFLRQRNRRFHEKNREEE